MQSIFSCLKASNMMMVKNISKQVLILLKFITSKFLNIKLQKRNSNISVVYDRTLLWLMLGLIATGFIMVISTSMPIGLRLANDPFLFAKRDSLYIILAFGLAKNTLCLPMKFWQRYSSSMLIVSIIMLAVVAMIGSSLNGASRWIVLGPVRIQPSEFTKFSFFCYLSNYIAKKTEGIRNDLYSLLKPMIVILTLGVFLLIQPDLGTIIVLLATTLGILFLAGAKLKQLITIICVGVLLVTLLVFSKPYRIHRVTSFLNPWKDAFGSGYQLTQSLMAFGRGNFWGQGLGNSIQKMEYLPEAHTDFIFSVLGEELGYVGVVLSLLMVFSISLRAMLIGRKALTVGLYFSGFLACSIGIWFSFQTLINVGSVTGILPTKGLTFPLISYGGSSLLVMSNAIIILIRIDHETRFKNVQAFTLDLQ